MFVFQGRILIERGSHYVRLPFEQYFWISSDRVPANIFLTGSDILDCTVESLGTTPGVRKKYPLRGGV